MRPSLRAFVLAGVAVALLVGMGLANLAAPDPDGLERVLIETQCEPGADPDACLDGLAGEPAYDAAPLPDYDVVWLSGFVGVAACFLLGTGLVLLTRRGRRDAAGFTPAAPPPRPPRQPTPR